MRDPLSAGRTRLVLDHPWLSALIFRLRPRPARLDEGITTVATDGRELIFSPAFVEKLTPDEQAGVLAHESLHCGFLHHARRGARDPQRWNIAADYAINVLLLDAGVSLPAGGLVDPKYRGLSAEEIYDQLPTDAHSKTANDLRDGPADSHAPADARKWSEALAGAMHAAQRAGVLPDGADRAIQEALAARINWRELLAEHIRRSVGAEDYSYARPSRRGRGLGLILPGTYAQECGPVVVCIDTSGSMSAEDISLALTEIRSALDTLPMASLTVIEADAAVHRVTELSQGDDWSPPTLKGGGGTDFRPAIVEAEKREPAIIIYLSDLDGTFPINIDTDLLWLTRSTNKAPIGRTIKMEEDQ